MILLSQELPLSISLNQDTYRNAAQFARAGFEAAECCLPVHYHAEVDLSIFPAYLEEVCPRIADGGLRIASFHLPFGTYWDISSPDETIRAGAVQALAQLIRLLAPYPGNNLVLHPSFEPIEEGAREAHIAACQKSLRELAPIAEETGKKIALENLPRTCLGRTSQEMERITESGALCGICMDTTHMVPRNAAGLFAALRKMGDQHPPFGLLKRAGRVPLGARNRQLALARNFCRADRLALWRNLQL